MVCVFGKGLAVDAHEEMFSYVDFFSLNIFYQGAVFFFGKKT